MNTRQAHIAFWFAILTLAACGDPSDPSRIAPPSFAVGGVGRPVVLVNPNMKGSGTATTIQEGIDMVDRGGKVLVLPGTYDEAIVIDKGLTLEGLGGESGPVVVSPSGTVGAAIHVATPDPVTIRGLSVRYTGTRGLFGDGVVDLTVERVSVVAVSPPLGVTGLISVINDAPACRRARKLCGWEPAVCPFTSFCPDLRYHGRRGHRRPTRRKRDSPHRGCLCLGAHE